jgi:MFS family permease
MSSDLEEIIKNYSKIFAFNRLFLRDIAISKAGFASFYACFAFATISINFIIVYLFNFNPISIVGNYLSLFAILTIFISILLVGVIVDKAKHRVRLLIISSIVGTFGLYLMLFNEALIILGIVVLILFTGIFVIDLITILIHESTILNRGRLFGYLFFLSFITSHFVLLIANGNIFFIFLAEVVLTIAICIISFFYTYIETKERLTSDKKFIGIITESINISGYMLAIFIVSFAIGNAYPIQYDLDLRLPVFVVLFVVSFIIIGVSLDNLGRKWTLALMILVISSVILFSEAIPSEEIYLSIFFGIFIPGAFTILFTFAGDFSTERKIIKYRGRLTCVFIMLLLGGFMLGIIINFLLSNSYSKNSDILFWIPPLLKGLSPFFLIVVLVWIMPLPEILTAKEADWKESLKDLYVFNIASVCLYHKKFDRGSPNGDLLSEDLITGGLTGILSMISEIINEKQNLRIIVNV